MTTTTDRPTKSTRSTKDDRRYDAIVVGGGHNGLVNGAYLAKSGLRTLILERRHLVGGATPSTPLSRPLQLPHGSLAHSREGPHQDLGRLPGHR